MFEVCLKVFRSSYSHWVYIQRAYNVHTESSGGFSVYYKKFIGVQNLSLLQKFIGGQKQHVFQQYDFSFNVYKNVGNTNSEEHTL